MNKATSADEFKLTSSFDEVRRILLDDKYNERLEKPLAYWALPNDRRLPLAFLGRTLRELLTADYSDLSNTSGIGQKKMGSLVKLLHRATQDNPPAMPFGISELSKEVQEAGESRKRTEKFDPSIVSEALWEVWKDSVVSHRLGHEKLGRLAPSLQSLPTVIWNTPLSQYLNYSVQEIRQLKTHGEKRVRVVLEIFFVVHQILENATQAGHLAHRLIPSFVPPIEAWLNRMIAGDRLPERQEIIDCLTVPILKQIDTDAGPTVFQLAEGRLGIGSEPQSVRTQSRKMAVTRARVYQLLDECAKVMEVRWPDGERLLQLLIEKCKRENAIPSDLGLLMATRELFYPSKLDLMDECDREAENDSPAEEADLVQL